MSISFTQIPASNLTPGVYTEYDGSGLPGVQAPRSVIIIGYDDTANAGVRNTPTPVLGKSSPWDGHAQISHLIDAYRRVDPSSAITAIALAPPTGGTAATGTIQLSGTATENGTLYVFVGGELFQVGVVSGDTATEVATAVASAVNASASRIANATAATGTVTLTARFAGSEGNRILLAVDVRASQTGVAGIAPVVTSFSGGAGQANVADALALVASISAWSIVCGLSDSTTLATLNDEMNRRDGAMVEMHGQAFVGLDGTFAEMITEASTSNALGVTALGAGRSLTPAWEVAAMAAAHDTVKPDPARGYKGMLLPSALAPEPADVADKGERDALLAAGVSTVGVSGSSMVLDRLVTMKTRNTAGDVDLAELALTTRRTVQVLRDDWRSRLQRKYVNYKIADSADVRPRDGDKILTPAKLKDESIAWFKNMRDDRGLVQGIEKFKEAIATQVNAGDPNRLDALLPPKLIRELVTIASGLQPR